MDAIVAYSEPEDASLRVVFMTIWLERQLKSGSRENTVQCEVEIHFPIMVQ